MTVVILACISSKGILLHNNPKRGWELPGGRIENGETAEQAMRREMNEEVGWCPSMLKEVCPVDLGNEQGILFTSGEKPSAIANGKCFHEFPDKLAFPVEELKGFMKLAKGQRQ